MRKTILLPAALLAVLLSGCNYRHLINDRSYLNVVEKSFESRKSLCAGRNDSLFSVFNERLTTDQSEALKFLYAFMPLNDLADHNGNFFLANVNASLRARAETPWGMSVPDDIFLHYVLPLRVNNENLDSFRTTYYNEIMNRIKGMNIHDAALEINHWCHEKVAYQASDDRTSAPMATILSARGRCGEESTFTVAALRTAGIPARQVYTPRWAHCDDNHAWVEIWDNGEWYYTGACEPEPVLDLGWFTEPARRAMLIHTKSFGAPTGGENTITKGRFYSDVNNLSKYAVTKTIYVRITDQKGKPVSNANVEYQLYNYAEFYPLANVPTDSAGMSHFETGLGDLLIWAYKNDAFNYRKISVGDTDTLTLRLDNDPANVYSVSMDLSVPVVRAPLPGPFPTQVAENKRRIDQENAIRQRYIDSWMKPEQAARMADDLGLDRNRVMSAIARSMGNYKEISSFIKDSPDSLKNRALDLLEVLPDKDLRDTRESTLNDHLLNCRYIHAEYDGLPQNFFVSYVLNPRVSYEILSPWRSYLQKYLPADLRVKGYSDPSLMVKFIKENIKIDTEDNYYGTPLTPSGVMEIKTADNESRAVFLVAACRSLGIPARLEPGIRTPQFYKDGKWTDVYFSDQEQPGNIKGYLKLKSGEKNPLPEYYIHFTIARFENGRYNTLEYDFNKKITDFKDDLALPPGNYRLVTGNRLPDGGVLSEMSFFSLKPDEHKTIVINLRKDRTTRKTEGKVDLKGLLNLVDKTGTVSDRGTVLIWIDPDREPTKHVFNDLASLKKELDAWGGDFIFLYDPSDSKTTFNPASISGMPSNSVFGNYRGMDTFSKLITQDTSLGMQLPVVMLCDRNGNIIYRSAGYKIGIGEDILSNIY